MSEVAAIAQAWETEGPTLSEAANQPIGDTSMDRGKGRDPHHTESLAHYRPCMANRYEYAVIELREGMLGGKMSGEKLQNVLNQQAAQGWQLKAITAVEVKGRIGPGGVEGVLVTFERPVG